MKVTKKNIVTLDFETYYSTQYSLSANEYNTSSYVRDPQFKAHCCAVKIGTAPSKCYPGEELPKVFAKIDWSKTALLAHNTAFDGFILAERYGIVPAFYLDTLSMTRGLHSEMTRASLDRIAKYYGLGAKHEGALENTRGIRDLPPDKLARLMRYCNNDNELCFSVFEKQFDVYPQAELELIDLTIRMFTTSPLKVDLKLARSALGHEILEKQATILRVKHLASEADLQSNPKFATALHSLGVEPPVKMSLKTGMESFAFAQTDPEFIELLDHEDLQVRHLVEARLAAKSTQTETRAYRLIQAGETGTLPVGYNYYAAKTGRWGGTNKLNLQNLPRVDKKNPKPSDGLRRSIIAPTGHVLVVGDSSQIEARLNAWQAGDEELLAMFAEGIDPYCDMASTIYSKPIDKDKHPLERFIGKVAVLGLGYQMGHRKFQTTLAQGVMGPPVELELPAAARIVNIYRSKRRKIAQSWETARHVLDKMARGLSGKWGVLHYEDKSLWLPNGMGLHYPQLHHNGSEFSFKSNGVWKKVYGGLVIENVVQALARIVVADQMLTMSKKLRELPLKDKQVAQVVMMTHDEIVCCVPKEHAKAVLKMQLSVMSTPPSWCSDIPLNAEAGYAVNYSK